MTVRLPKNEDERIQDAGDVARIMQKILLRQNRHSRNKEYFWAIGLNVKRDIEYIELVTIGTANRNIVKPADVFSLALQKKCVGIILCHNHPSGDLTPSDKDLQFTDAMEQAGVIVEVRVMDHIIISEKDFRIL
ncbi:JAB domain-containing protein [Maribacter sp. 2-571]|uniref:JAB domain-containing protein n=1 Tax=Maribacter sp. 2-571 TaxID=3417569 RepID=UPI003D339F8B